MMRAPLVFLSHGAPDIALMDNPVQRLWSKLGHELPTPQAILVVSAHWATPSPLLSTALMPTTLHDFCGFPPALDALDYPAVGAPELASKVADCLNGIGVVLKLEPERGLDHGAWIPLLNMYPHANIPVTQLSLQPTAGTRWHWQLGQALRTLRDEGVMIIGSGSVTHNFGWLSEEKKEPYAPAQMFSDWLGDALQRHATAALLDYRECAPYGKEAHPTEEHLLPLFVTLGASTPTDRLTRHTPGFTYGALMMDAYVWQ